jgi:hypothetical protein
MWANMGSIVAFLCIDSLLGWLVASCWLRKRIKPAQVLLLLLLLLLLRIVELNKKELINERCYRREIVFFM